MRRTSDFRRVYGARQRVEGHLLIVHSVSNGLDHPRVGFSVSSKVGGAVLRNRLRRRLREAARPLIEASSTGLDMVVVARPEAAEASFAELDAELRSVIGKLIS